MLKIVQEAGWPIWPLILCSIAAVALIVERFMALRTARIAPGYLLGEVIAVTRNGLPSADVVAKLADNSLLGSVLASGLKLLAVDPRGARGGLVAQKQMVDAPVQSEPRLDGGRHVELGAHAAGMRRQHQDAAANSHRFLDGMRDEDQGEADIVP